MEEAYKIAGTVILYNPPSGFVDNISRYLADIDRLYVIDNSEHLTHEHKARLSGSPKIEYIALGENFGIAKALNIGAELAIKGGYDFLLTMDQDSEASPNMLKTMLACMDSYKQAEVGIIAPRQIYTSFADRQTNTPCEEILTTMTSGNLLNLQIYKAVGPFLDMLFIDFVDHEYCMRLRSNRFKIIQANKAILNHKLGDVSEHNLFFKHFAISNHAPLRRYYSTRNKFYLYDHYRNTFPEYFRSFFKYIFFDILSIIIYEKDKLDKLKMTLQGYLDYKKDTYGKYKT